MSLVVDALKKLKTESQLSSDPNGLPPITDYIDESIESSFNFNKKTAIILSSALGIIVAIVIFVMFLLPMFSHNNNIPYNATITSNANKQQTSSSNATVVNNSNNQQKPIQNTNQNTSSNVASSNATASSMPTVSNNNQVSQNSNNSAVSDFFPANSNQNTNTQSQVTATTPSIQKQEEKSSYIDPIQALLPPTTVKKEEEPVIKINNTKENTNPLINTTIPSINQQKDSINTNTNTNINNTPAATNSGNYESYIKNAINAFNKKDYKTSLNLYLQAYTIHKEPAVAENITSLYVLNDQPTNAVKFIKDNNVTNPTFVSNLIMNLVDKSYRYEASQLINYSQRFNDNGDLAFSEGYYHINNQNFIKAEIAFNRARNLNPTNPVYAYTYATVIESDGKHKEALQIYRNVLNLNPDEEITHRTKARIDALEKLYK